VVLSDDPGIHLRNMQSTPPIEEEATTCVECGMCEPACPSRNVTTTPRQRILLRREKLIKAFRRRERTEGSERAAEAVARNWASAERAARAGLRAGRAAGPGLADTAAKAARSIAGAELVPRWPPSMPAPAPAVLPRTSREGAGAVYMPACINRIFGADGETSLPRALVDVSARAGRPLWIPGDVAGNCCATPWASKGYVRGRKLMSRRVAESVLRWTGEGSLPLVVDASSCAHGLVREVAEDLDDELRERYAAVETLDSIEWVHDRLLPSLRVTRRAAAVAVHPTCSVKQLGLAAKLGTIAGELADEVVLPAATSCCGMAGDRGLLHPELPASALRDEASELAGLALDACLSSNRTCEIGLRQETGRPFESFVFLLERLTR
jgi:D-lactate dehydrogenase